MPNPQARLATPWWAPRRGHERGACAPRPATPGPRVARGAGAGRVVVHAVVGVVVAPDAPLRGLGLLEDGRLAVAVDGPDEGGREDSGEHLVGQRPGGGLERDAGRVEDARFAAEGHRQPVPAAVGGMVAAEAHPRSSSCTTSRRWTLTPGTLRAVPVVHSARASGRWTGHARPPPARADARLPVRERPRAAGGGGGRLRRAAQRRHGRDRPRRLRAVGGTRAAGPCGVCGGPARVNELCGRCRASFSV